MTYVNPRIRAKFDSLSPELKKEIWSRNDSINNLNDLVHTLQSIVDENETS